MPAANVLSGDDVAGSGPAGASIYGTTGSYPAAATSTDAVYAPIADDGDTTSIKVAVMIVAAALFIVALRRGGFRDMVATP